MIKKNDFNGRPGGNNNHAGSAQGFAKRNPHENNQNRENNQNKEANQTKETSPNREPNHNRENNQARENNQVRENRPNRDNNQQRNFNREMPNRDNSPRPSYSNQSSASRHYNRIRSEETIDDIKSDIIRIEKEIELELKEIKTLRLGM